MVESLKVRRAATPFGVSPTGCAALRKVIQLARALHHGRRELGMLDLLHHFVRALLELDMVHWYATIGRHEAPELRDDVVDDGRQPDGSLRAVRWAPHHHLEGL